MGTSWLVATQACGSYELEHIRKAVRAVVGLLPESSACFRAGRTVLVKPNIVTPRGPERPVCTHPNIVRAVAEVACEAGCSVLVADQPTYTLAPGSKEALAPTGYHEALRGLPVEVGLLARDGYEPVAVPSPLHFETAYVARMARQADAVVNLAKCKTHIQTTLTLAVKNMFGVIAPRDRMRVHARGSYHALAEALADCYSALVPQLNVMDAVVGMQGAGPSQGRPAQIGLVAGSANAVSLDMVMEDLVGMGGQVALTRAAAEKGLGPRRLQDIPIAGAEPDAVRTTITPPPRLLRSFPPVLSRLGERLIYVRPRVNRRKCVACGGCAEVCPVGAISVGRHATVDRGTCVECFCCMEACPADAISVERSLLSHLL